MTQGQGRLSVSGPVELTRVFIQGRPRFLETRRTRLHEAFKGRP